MTTEREYVRNVSIFTTIVLLILAGVLAALLNWRTNTEIAQSKAEAQQLNEKLTADVGVLTEQLRKNKLQPVLSDGKPAPTSTARPVLLIPGTPGKDGRNGLNGKDGVGTPGRDGRNGLNGRDSTVPGPMSTITPSPGAKGDKGDKGDPGTDGKDASPAPTPEPCDWEDDPFHPGKQVCTRPSPTPAPAP
jgi:hypothetical protein